MQHPADMPLKAAEDGPTVWAAAPTWETRTVSGYWLWSVPIPYHCTLLRGKPKHGRPLALSISFPQGAYPPFSVTLPFKSIKTLLK